MVNKQPIVAKAIPFDCSSKEGNKKTKWKGVQVEEGREKRKGRVYVVYILYLNP